MTRCTIRHISVEDIFALTDSNVVHVEWDVVEVDRDDHRYRLTGVGAFVIEQGKVRSVKDYIFDQPLLETIFASEGAATSSTVTG